MDVPLADRAARIFDEEKIARARLQCALKSAFLRDSAHLFALLLAFGRLGSRKPMRLLALTRAEAAVADAPKLLVRVLGGARRTIILQPAPNIRNVSALGWLRRRLDRRKISFGLVEQLVGTLVRLFVLVGNALESARVFCKNRTWSVERG